MIEKEKNKTHEHKKYDSFIVVCMSHGNRGVMYDKDGQAMDIETEIIEPFDGWNWPIFKDKPKLFFIQACQGCKYCAPQYLLVWITVLCEDESYMCQLS